MRRGIIAIVIFAILLVLPSVIRYGRYNQLGGTERATPPAYNPADSVASVPTPAAASFADDPEVAEGVVLLDQAHNNLFEMKDIDYLNGRLSARGIKLIPFTGGDLVSALRGVNAFISIVPLAEFSPEEVQAVSDFVGRGGRLLMVGDPTRFNVSFDEESLDFSILIEDDQIPLNSLSNTFDIVFKGDYLYNTRENEGNFRNIILKEAEIGKSSLTEGVKRLVFYGTHSLDLGPDSESLLAGDDNTWSSATDRPGGLTLAATSQNGRVLALGDIHFIGEPYYTVYDNGRFIAQIADFLAEPSREFILNDFPYFFADEVNLVYTDQPDLGAEAFADIIPLQKAFQRIGKALNLAGEADTKTDTFYLGLYNQSDDVADILEAHGVTLLIEPPILTEEEQKALEEEADDENGGESEAETEDDNENANNDNGDNDNENEAEEEVSQTRIIQSDLGNVQMSGMALILLDESGGQRNLVVLAASKDGLRSASDRLLNLIPLNADYTMEGCLIQDNLALCPTGIADEEVEAELLTGGTAVAPAEDSQPPEDVVLPPDLNAESQGVIGLDETVEATLEPGVNHAWTFNQGPTTIDISLTVSEEMDGVIELYSPEGELLRVGDGGGTGADEEILGAEIADDGTYTIVVRDFFGNGGSYSLTISETVGPLDDGELNIFYFIDDDGTPIGEGFTSADVLLGMLLAQQYEVQVWSSLADGPLQDDTLDGSDFLIWDSGDFQTEEGFADPDANIIFSYLDSGNPIFITGSSPAIIGDIELAPIGDVEVVSSDSVLVAGFTPGEIILLNGVYETALSDLLVEDTDSGSTPFLLRGPASEGPGNVAALATTDSFSNQQSVFMLFPFAVLPEEAQTTLFDNLMVWFGFAN
ncbi:MAG: hypothetical protein HF973_04705 [Chloroflexi bacterium]|nr:hypothetical protein [Chloroflexota bacterium]